MQWPVSEFSGLALHFRGEVQVLVWLTAWSIDTSRLLGGFKVDHIEALSVVVCIIESLNFQDVISRLSSFDVPNAQVKEENPWTGGKHVAGLFGWLLAWLVGSVLTRSSLQILAAGYGAWTLSGRPATNYAKCWCGFARELLLYYFFTLMLVASCSTSREVRFQMKVAIKFLWKGWTWGLCGEGL